MFIIIHPKIYESDFPSPLQFDMQVKLLLLLLFFAANNSSRFVVCGYCLSTKDYPPPCQLWQVSTAV